MIDPKTYHQLYTYVCVWMFRLGFPAFVGIANSVALAAVAILGNKCNRNAPGARNLPPVTTIGNK